MRMFSSLVAVPIAVVLAVPTPLSRAAPPPPPPPPRPPIGTPAPQPIYVASLGAGPVVKSPSLLVLGARQLPAGFSVRQGTFESVGARSGHPVALGGLARYTESVAGPGALSDSATLYQNSPAATRAFAALLSGHHTTPVRLSTSQRRGIEAIRGWNQGGQAVVAARVENVVMVLAGSGKAASSLPSLARRNALNVPGWLHASGTRLVDRFGRTIILKGLSWYGAEERDLVVGGLEYQSYQEIIQKIEALGYNVIRLPLCEKGILTNPVIVNKVAKSPDLKGLHYLDIVDRIVNYAGALGLSVILDDHRQIPGWGSTQNGLWYGGSYTQADFLKTWSILAHRYSRTNVVIGTDLHNELHSTATWGMGTRATDWRLAAQRAGNEVLGINSRVLIIVEGVEYYRGPPGYWWGGNLMGVASAPIRLRFKNGKSAKSRLLYSIHDYGPNPCNFGCPWFNSTTSYKSLSATWNHYWGYILNPTKSYAAPIWIGEFGTCYMRQSCVQGTKPGSQGQWFSSLLRFIKQKHLSWTNWAANGTESTGGLGFVGHPTLPGQPRPGTGAAADLIGRSYGDPDNYGLLDVRWNAARPIPYRAQQSILH